jgi:hypothetical protein
VVTPEGRAKALGQPLSCRKCDAALADETPRDSVAALSHPSQPKESSMKAIAIACLAAAAALHAPRASAESLRCNGYSASEGDSRNAVLYKCGQPLLRDVYCSPVYYSQTLQPVPEPIANAFVPCQAVEEWLYERGPGQLTATVRFRAGVVQSIRYGREPQ